MKRLTTYYFLLLVFLNVLFALYLLATTASCENSINEFLGGSALPLWTELAIRYSWWPWVGVVICIVGTMLSLWGRPKDSILRNLLIVFLIVELWVMFNAVMAFTIPGYRQ